MTRCLALQGAAAAEQAQRLNEEVAAERERVRAALAALEAERARLDARSAAETERLQVPLMRPGQRHLRLLAGWYVMQQQCPHGGRWLKLAVRICQHFFTCRA